MSARKLRYSDDDVRSLLIGTSRPAWERTAHIKAAAKQRGYAGADNIERMIAHLEEHGALYARTDGPIAPFDFQKGVQS